MKISDSHNLFWEKLYAQSVKSHFVSLFHFISMRASMALSMPHSAGKHQSKGNIHTKLVKKQSLSNLLPFVCSTFLLQKM